MLYTSKHAAHLLFQLQLLKRQSAVTERFEQKLRSKGSVTQNKRHKNEILQWQFGPKE